MEKDQKSLDFLTMGNKYLWLVRSILEENIKNDKTGYGYDSEEEMNKDDGRWSYRMIIIPTLFTFYHGLELTMKGFLILASKYNSEHKHLLTELLRDFQREYSAQKEIFDFLEKYIVVEKMPPLLKDWFQKHNLEMNNYYNYLRYPFDLNLTNRIDYSDLKYSTNVLSEPLVSDIKKVLPYIERAFREHSISTK